MVRHSRKKHQALIRELLPSCIEWGVTKSSSAADASKGLLTGQIVFSSAFVGACELPNWIQVPRQVNACRSRSKALALFFPSGMQTAIATNQPALAPARRRVFRMGHGMLDVYELIKLYTSAMVTGFPCEPPMRTNIVIDDALMRQAMQASGARSKREAVELGLRTLVRLQQQGEIRSFRGKLRWDGDLEAQRLDADPEPGEPADQELASL